MVAAGVLAITFFVLLAASLIAGIIISANSGDDDAMVIAAVVAWFSGLLGSISLIAFAIFAVIKVLS
jgi:hypothetical protein